MAQAHSAKADNSANGKDKTSVISAGTEIKGNFTSSENLRIDGIIIGDVICKKRLVVGRNGLIKGKVTAASLGVEGKIEGEIHSEGEILLKTSAEVIGIVTAPKMEVEEGALFNGELRIGHAKTTSRSSK